MVDTIPIDDFDDEWLSAYVDGELAGRQRELVEQRLATDPHAALLVEELRAVSRELQALPEETVGGDLRAAIMQRAERAMLLGADEQRAVVPHRATSGRRWIWAGLALAASLLLTAYLPTLQRERQPLASAKPAPDDQTGEKTLDVPRLEAVTADEAKQPAAAGASQMKSLSMRTGDMAVEKAVVDQEVAVENRAAARAPPASAANGIADRTDEVQLACLVHITLSAKETAGAQLEKHLVNNGIEFRHGKNTRTPQGDSKAKGLAFRSQGQVAQDLAAEAVKSEQLVWIEAPTEQVANVLEDVNADTINCEAVQVTELRPALQPLGQLRQWERRDRQLAPKQQHPFKRDVLASKKATQGWATRLDANQYHAGKLNVDLQFLDPKSDFPRSAPQSPIQVLFIIQQVTSEGAAAVSGEAAVRGR